MCSSTHKKTVQKRAGKINAPGRSIIQYTPAHNAGLLEGDPTSQPHHQRMQSALHSCRVCKKKNVVISGRKTKTSKRPLVYHYRLLFLERMGGQGFIIWAKLYTPPYTPPKYRGKCAKQPCRVPVHSHFHALTHVTQKKRWCQRGGQGAGRVAAGG